MPPNPATADSAQYSTVSVIRPLFMITVMPRATPMISATPSISRAPSTKVLTRSFSERRADDADQDAEEQEIGSHFREPPPPGGNGNPQVFPRDHAVDHVTKARKKNSKITLWRVVNFPKSVPSPLAAQELFLKLGFLIVDQRFGRVFLHPLSVAHHEHDADDGADTRSTIRPISPSLMVVPAKPEAIPVAKGLTVEPRQPIPAPSRIRAPAERAS